MAEFDYTAHRGKNFGRGYGGVISEKCPDCLERNVTVRLLLDPEGWVMCGLCDYEAHRQEPLPERGRVFSFPGEDAT